MVWGIFSDKGGRGLNVGGDTLVVLVTKGGDCVDKSYISECGCSDRASRTQR